MSGLKVTNQYDYVADYPQLETLNASNFRTFALANNIVLPKKTATISVYARDLTPIISEKVVSPLVIFEKPLGYSTGSTDINAGLIKNSLLGFVFSSDMFSANQTKGVRAFVPIVFSYVIPNAPFSWSGFSNEVGEFVANPVGKVGEVLLANWFILVIISMFAVVVSLVYANLKGGGGSTININNGS